MTTDSLSQQISKQAGWSLFMGVLTAAIGMAMIIYPMATATASTLFFGGALIFAGVAQAVFAFSSQTMGNFFLKLLLGILYGIAGIMLVLFLPAGVLTLTAAIGVMLIAEAVIEIVLARSLPVAGGRGLFVASAAASALLGILILAEWPNSAVWTIGTLVGAAVLFNGISRIVISSTVLKGVHDFKQVPKAA
ncbi:MAG TPA: DUF308 domain-containing protein [Thermoanaerobaculia bacterium]|nr:DUF308 domain-containing protein [Thermoanaerobaculia bacterium]